MIIRMQALELKIPPPAVAVLLAGAMWGISLVAPLVEVPAFIRVAAAVTIALAGGGFSLAGVISFRRARRDLRVRLDLLVPGGSSSGWRSGAAAAQGLDPGP